MLLSPTVSIIVKGTVEVQCPSKDLSSYNTSYLVPRHPSSSMAGMISTSPPPPAP